MIPVLSAEQIRSADAWTIRHEPIASIDLMERAASACTVWLSAHYHRSTRFRILCGPGNNGGDGLAIARQLYQSGYDVEVDRICTTEKFSEDHAINHQRLRKLIGSDIREVRTIEAFRDLHEDTIIVDALFGTGLGRPLAGLYAEVIQRVNAARGQVVSIDLPSGLPTDNSMEGMIAVNATTTLSFQTPKRTFFFPETGEQAGRWILLDIGVKTEQIHDNEIREYLFTRADALRHFGKRRRFSHKGDFGHACLIAGSTGKLGAALLAAKAALRTGTGLLTVHLPGTGLGPMQTALPEAMVSIASNIDCVDKMPEDLDRFDAIAIGPGLGTSTATAAMLRSLLKKCQAPLVIDADGLNILSVDRSMLSLLPKGTILTPHPGEFDRLFGTCKDTAARITQAQAFTASSECVLVLKGGCTAVVLPTGEVHFNATGNPGMAKGGSGDALTGILLALLCNGLSSADAASVGVFLHAAAGDWAAEKFGERSLLPSDLIKALPVVIRALEAGT